MKTTFDTSSWDPEFRRIFEDSERQRIAAGKTVEEADAEVEAERARMVREDTVAAYAAGFDDGYARGRADALAGTPGRRPN